MFNTFKKEVYPKFHDFQDVSLPFLDEPQTHQQLLHQYKQHELDQQQSKSNEGDIIGTPYIR